MSDPLNDLHKAIHTDEVDDVLRLLAGGVPPGAAHPGHGNTPLRSACQRDALKSMRVLLEHGADPNQRITYRSPVDKRVEEDYFAMMYVTGAAAAELLFSFGADVNLVSADGLSALMRHARFGNAEVIEVLLKHGADTSFRLPKRRGRKEHTALELAEGSLAFWRSLRPDQLKPEAAGLIAEHARAVELLRGVAGE